MAGIQFINEFGLEVSSYIVTLEGKPNTQKIMNVEFNLLMNLSWWSASRLWQRMKYLFPLTKRTQMLIPQTVILHNA